LGGLIQTLGYFAILLAVVFLIVATLKAEVVDIGGVNVSDTSTFTSAYNSTVETQEAMGDIPGWLPIIVIAVIGGILLTLIQFFRGQ